MGHVEFIQLANSMERLDVLDSRRILDRVEVMPTLLK